MPHLWQRIPGTIVPGHGIASGESGDPRFPGGSIALQSPHFLAAGIDLSGYHPGTLNLSIAPKRYKILQAAHTIRQLTWLPNYPPEDFSFFNCRLTPPDNTTVDGLIDCPHPETKPEFHQDPSVLEILAPYLSNLRLGDSITIELPPTQIQFFTPPRS